MPKTSALDHSAKLPYDAFDKSINIFIPSKYDYISYKTAIDWFQQKIKNTQNKLPPERIELSTPGLRDQCSTTEL